MKGCWETKEYKKNKTMYGGDCQNNDKRMKKITKGEKK